MKVYAAFVLHREFSTYSGFDGDPDSTQQIQNKAGQSSLSGYMLTAKKNHIYII
jgi:hypothetical protein